MLEKKKHNYRLITLGFSVCRDRKHALRLFVYNISRKLPANNFSISAPPSVHSVLFSQPLFTPLNLVVSIMEGLFGMIEWGLASFIINPPGLFLVSQLFSRDMTHFACHCF